MNDIRVTRVKYTIKIQKTSEAKNADADDPKQTLKLTTGNRDTLVTHVLFIFNGLEGFHPHMERFTLIWPLSGKAY